MVDKPWIELGLTDGEYSLIVGQLGREPNLVELNMYSVMWSEHCSYKHSRAELRKFPTEGPRVLQGPGENAGVVDIGEGWACAFKIESHNHPSAVEPYQGAATGVGGILRDIFTMGARPVAFLNSLRFGELSDPRVRYLFDRVVAGIGGYGNCVGIPTVAGEVYFEPCYRGNPLVNAMCVGVMRSENLVLGKASGEGNLVFLAGARTGKDGIHGVTFASEELNAASEEKRPSVQVGDPFMGKLLMEATLELIEKGLAAGVQDLGGAGLTCALTETAARAGTGIEVDLDQVPLREEGMLAHEILVSESQERMLYIIEPRHREEVEKIFIRWGLPYANLGRVTTDGMVRALFRGEKVVNLPAASVAGGAPECEPGLAEPAYYGELKKFKLPELPGETNYNRALQKLLGDSTVASKEAVWRRYDYSVRTSTLQGPGGDAAVIRIRENGKALALTVDGNGRHSYLDPYIGGIYAVAEATRNLSCTGAEPVGITDCLNFGNPEKAEISWQFQQTVEGMSEACRVLGVPVVGGNVSFYNEVEGEAIYPTPVVGAVGLLAEPEKMTRSAFKSAGDHVLLLGSKLVSLGGSQYLKCCHNVVAGALTRPDLELEKRLQELLRSLINERLVHSAHDLSEGGLAVALAECCIGGELGCVLTLPAGSGRADTLFGEGPSRVIVSVHYELVGRVVRLAGKAKVPVMDLGEVGGEKLKIMSEGEYLVDIKIADLDRIYREVIACAMK